MPAENEWAFPDPPETVVATTREVLGGVQVSYVQHDAEGTWHFFHQDRIDGASYTNAALEDVIGVHPYLTVLAQLPARFSATPSEAGNWQWLEDGGNR